MNEAKIEYTCVNAVRKARQVSSRYFSMFGCNMTAR